MKKNFLKVIILSLLFIPCFVNAEVVNINNLEQLVSFFESGGDGVLSNNIELQNNITVSKKSKLDLSGYTIDTLSYTIAIFNDFDLTDSSSNSTGKVVGSSNYSFQVGNSSAGANFNLSSGSIISSPNTSARAVNIIKGLFTMNGGKIESYDYSIYNSDKVIINNGEVIADNTIAIRGNISSSTIINGGTIKLLGDGDAISLSESCSLTVNGGMIDATSDDGTGIVAYKNTTVTINDGTIVGNHFALCGNGSLSGDSSSINAKFFINGGSLISNETVAIYAPQVNGETVITGGTISGKTGIELRAGKLTITGGNISGDTSNYSVISNTNGTTTSGAAVAIVQHTTKQPIDVKITGGNFSGYVAVSEKNPLGNSSLDVEKISLNLSGGVFQSTSNNTIISEDCDDFIQGGQYSSSVLKYVVEGYKEKTESNGLNSVYKIRNVIVNEENEEDVTVSTNQTISGDEVEVNINELDDYDIVNVEIIDSSNNVIPVNSNSFISPDSDVTINVIVARVILPKEENNNIWVVNYDNTKNAIINVLKNDSSLYRNSTSNELIVELVVEEKDLTNEIKNNIIKKINTNYNPSVLLYDIYIVVKDKNNNELGRINELFEDIEFKVNLSKVVSSKDNNSIRDYYVIRSHNKYNIIYSKLTDNNSNLYFKSNKFSDYAIIYVDSKYDSSNYYDDAVLDNGSNDTLEPTNNGNNDSDNAENSNNNSEIGDIVPLPEQINDNESNSNSNVVPDNNTGNNAGNDRGNHSNPFTLDKIITYVLLFIICICGFYYVNKCRKKINN